MTSTIWAHATVDWMNLTVTPQDPPVQAPPPSGVWPTSPSPVPVTDTSQITAPVVPRPSPVGTTPMPTR
jgi:hypothetical protein